MNRNTPEVGYEMVSVLPLVTVTPTEVEVFRSQYAMMLPVASFSTAYFATMLPPVAVHCDVAEMSKRKLLPVAVNAVSPEVYESSAFAGFVFAAQFVLGNPVDVIATVWDDV